MSCPSCKADEAAAFGFGLVLSAVALALLLWLPGVVERSHLRQELRDLRQAAYKYGYAEYEIPETEEPKFKWRVPPGFKPELEKR